MRAWMLSGVLVAALAARASADASDDARFLEMLDKALVHPAPGPGLDRAPLAPPRWCAAVHGNERFDPGSMVDDLNQYRESHYNGRLIRSAANLCHAPDGPAVRRIAAEIEQYWINLTGTSEADAVATLAARVDTAAFAADRKQLCNALQPTGGNTESEPYVLANARSVLFFCQSSAIPVAPWLKDTPGSLNHLTAHLDRGAVERDEIVRLAWVMVEAWHEAVESTAPDRRILRYAIGQFDFQQLSRDKVLRALDAPPYRGNRFARAFVLESLGQWNLLRARIEADVKQRTADPAWKEVLIAAPQRGAAAWQASADRHKDALARSDEFERAFRDSPGATHGCLPALRADALALLKSLKHDSLATLRQQLSDEPVAGLLIDRLVHCYFSDGDPNVGWRIDAELGVPILRGPRAAARRAALVALGQVGSRLGISSDPFPKLELRAWYANGSSSIGGGDYGNDGLEVVSAIKKTAQGLRISFVNGTKKVMTQECREGNKVDRIDSDGTVKYRSVCRDTGLISKRNDVVIDKQLAGGIQVGRAIEVSRQDRHDGGAAIPIAVYADKAGKRLVAVDGLLLE